VGKQWVKGPREGRAGKIPGFQPPSLEKKSQERKYKQKKTRKEACNSVIRSVWTEKGAHCESAGKVQTNEFPTKLPGMWA